MVAASLVSTHAKNWGDLYSSPQFFGAFVEGVLTILGESAAQALSLVSSHLSLHTQPKSYFFASAIFSPRSSAYSRFLTSWVEHRTDFIVHEY